MGNKGDAFVYAYATLVGNIKHTLFFPRYLAAGGTSPGGLNIVFSVLKIVQRPKHRFLAKLWHKNDVFGEKKVCGGSKRRQETARLMSPREF